MTTGEELLNKAVKKTSTFVESRPKSERKKYGQFFTSIKTAKYMASMFNINDSKNTLNILDAGSGSGILTVSLCARLLDIGYKGTVNAVCYENDPLIISLLEENLSLFKTAKLDFHYNIRIENYILSNKFGNFFIPEEEFDLVIGNPPYKKILKEAPEAIHMPEICYGAPNMYFLFLAMSIQYLKKDGELVYIIPRSWTSGAYFAHFRKYLLSTCSIMNIHLFGSRNKVFDGESVLQETMIIKIKKSQKHPSKIQISFSETSDFSDTSYLEANYNDIVAPNGYVYLITNKSESDILSKLNKLPYTLLANNQRMRTGIIVDFRTRDVLRNKFENGTYPLFYAQHIKNGKVTWPIGQKNEYICTDKTGYLQENTNYIFVKRFTAKEEKRRLQCGIYLSEDYPKYKYISTQNKINYIKCKNTDEAYGLYVLLNSSLYDTYYRILNGSTQVNSTEINNMPVPSKEVIWQMGRELKGKDLNVSNCNNILNKWIS